jgi:HEAT repeat protein
VTAIGKQLLSNNLGLLQAALSDPDIWVRSEAAFFLAQSPHPSSVVRLLELLKGEELPVRIGVLRGLAEVGCGEFYDRVVDLARADGEPLEIRQAALTSISRSGRAGSEAILMECLRNARWEIRSTSIHLMGASHDHRFIPCLLKELERDTDNLVRQSIIEALIQIRASEAVPRMLQYLTDPFLKDAAYKFFVSLGKKNVGLIESEAQSVDFQTKMVLIDILKQLENM